jgi:hypothetical protein
MTAVCSVTDTALLLSDVSQTVLASVVTTLPGVSFRFGRETPPLMAGITKSGS